jgi:foldase protein PrsA
MELTQRSPRDESPSEDSRTSAPAGADSRRRTPGGNGATNGAVNRATKGAVNGAVSSSMDANAGASEANTARPELAATAANGRRAARKSTPRGARPAGPGANGNARSSRDRRRMMSVPYAWVAAALIVGAITGALVARHRLKGHSVVVAVNGSVITADSFDHRLQLAAGEAVLRQMVNETLQLQFAAKQGVAPTDAEIEKEYAEVSQQPGFADLLAARRESIEDYKHELRVQLSQAKVLSKDMTITQPDMKQFYDTNISPANPKALFYTPASVTAAVIVNNTETASRQAFQQLNQGISFDTVARTRSDDASSSNGGVLPTIQQGRSDVRKIPGLEEAIFGLKVGDTLPPTQFGGHWWIIQCLDKKPASRRSFESVPIECRVGAMLTKGAQLNTPAVEAKYAEFRSASQMQPFWSQYANALSK